MSDDFRLKRHVELADHTAKSMKRIGLAGLVFSSFILVNVLQPYSDDFDESSQVRGSLVEKQEEAEQTRRSLQAVQAFSGVVSQTMNNIKLAPWDSHKDQLIATYARMRSQGTGTRAEYQDLADATVGRIASDIHSAISPLADSLAATPVLSRVVPDIDSKQQDLKASIDDWKIEKTGEVWYGTIDGKAETIRNVNENVEGRVSDMASDVGQSFNRLSESVRNAELQLNEELAQRERDARVVQTRLNDLNKKMQSAMPAWLRGYIGVEQMVQLFPIIVFGLTVYLLYSGLVLTRHHEIIAQAKQWSVEERQDPLFSASWTLVYRGPAGTATTIVMYAGVFMVTWVFVKTGGDILLEWLATGHEPAVNKAVYPPAINSIFVLLVAGLTYVMWRTLRDRIRRA